MTPGPERRVAVVVAAAGAGVRFGAGQPKAFAEFAGQTLLEHCLEGLLAADFLPQIVVAVPQSHVGAARRIRDGFPSLDIDIVVGGKDRSDTVRRALEAVRPHTEIVLVHDAARAFTPVEVFQRVVDEVSAGSASVVPVVPVADTVRGCLDDGTCTGVVDRSHLRLVQTPQGFEFSSLMRAYDDAAAESATDDAAIMERAGHTTVSVPGDRRAFKVTDPFDRVVVSAILADTAHDA